MATIATFGVASEDSPLGRLLAEHPDARIEMESTIPIGAREFPDIWLDGPIDEMVDTLATEPGISDISTVDRQNGTVLLRVKWDDRSTCILSAFDRVDIDLLSAVGEDGEWTFTVRALDREQIDDFQQHCLSCDPPVVLRLRHIGETAGQGRGAGYGLTDAQKEALLLAHNRGYFEEPQEATLDELADELGIARSSLSSRLQRAHDQLIEATIATDGAE